MDEESPSSRKSNEIAHKVYARVGLLGNPSDVYYGRTISFSLANFWATVKLQPSHHLIITPHPTHDLVQFSGLDHLVSFSSLLFLCYDCCIFILLFNDVYVPFYLLGESVAK
jgi:hypothetical protein